MIKAYILVRKEQHIDDKIIVSTNKEVLFGIADKMVNYWCDKYNVKLEELETKLFIPCIFNNHHDYFSVTIEPIKILENNEDLYE